MVGRYVDTALGGALPGHPQGDSDVVVRCGGGAVLLVDPTDESLGRLGVFDVVGVVTLAGVDSFCSWRQVGSGTPTLTDSRSYIRPALSGR